MLEPEAIPEELRVGAAAPEEHVTEVTSAPERFTKVDFNFNDMVFYDRIMAGMKAFGLKPPELLKLMPDDTEDFDGYILTIRYRHPKTNELVGTSHRVRSPEQVFGSEEQAFLLNRILANFNGLYNHQKTQ